MSIDPNPIASPALGPTADPAVPAGRRLITRRRALKAVAGAALAGAGTLGYATLIEPHWYEVVERSLPLAGLPRAWVGKRIVQISDLHTGRTDPDYLARVIAEVNGLSPDLLALTGDFIDHDTPQASADLPKILSGLRIPRMGAFACLGNHDYGHNWSIVPVADRVTAQLTDAGVTVLRNRAVDLSGLTLFGIDDLWSPRYNPWSVTAAIDPSRDALCLCHNPDANDYPAHWFKFRGYVLAGHTHGGQCKPPLLPPPLLPVANRTYVAGEYELSPTRRLYVNRGIGHSLRARFNCRPEITVFTLAIA